MSAAEIRAKTGIEQRQYTSLSLEEIALQAAEAALAKAGRGPEEIGAVLVCTCTSTRLIPSMATWLSGQLGIQQTHASYDMVAACAGLPYGLCEATRLLQEVQRPVLVVCAEKFSDKIGNVRHVPDDLRRRRRGDRVVVAPAPDEPRPTSSTSDVRQRPGQSRSTRSSGRTRTSTTTSPSTVRRSSPWPAATSSR